MSKLPIPGRKGPEHKILYLREEMGDWGGEAWDDELSFNTQGSSQWDSICHFQHQSTGLSYNGYKPSKEDFAVTSTAENKAPTIDHWHKRGGIVGRGVLIDWKAYTEERGIAFNAFDGKRITIVDIETCAHHFGIEFKPGDILIVRTGSTEIIEDLKVEDMGGLLANPQISGVHGSEETARWMWNKRFAAVASDNNSFEALPPVRADGTPGTLTELGESPLFHTSHQLTVVVLHEYLLSCFGMPIGELWDLSKLAKYCKEKKRYTFMLTSAPLNHPGLIGSPPNALAIF